MHRLSLKLCSIHGYKNIWSKQEEQNPLADSLLQFINQSKYYGLFPEDYHQNELSQLQAELANDSLSRQNAINWTKLDLLATDAFFRLLKDLKESRMHADSVSIIHKSYYVDSFFIKNLQTIFHQQELNSILKSAEPVYFKYAALQSALRSFVDKMDTTNYVQIDFPYEDSLSFVRNVYHRLNQSGMGNPAVSIPDSTAFVSAIKNFQLSKKLTADGKPGPATIRSMNNTDVERFKRIAVNLDRYKSLPQFPESYVWVNIPSFGLEVWQNDTLILHSKVIVGKPTTPTPELISNINNMVTFPNWTIPESIIKKDILPQLKKDPGYLARKGYNLFKENGEMVDPFSVDWNKYKTGIPWKVVQGSGDDNALGIFKFNFNNPYSVYLHDTNQRYLFANSDRALSHGCVRVQKWQALADFIADRDSLLMDKEIRLPYTKDSIQNWIAQKSRKSIMVKHRLPLFIEYFTCAVNDEEIVFYDDIYGEDAMLIKKYFDKN